MRDLSSIPGSGRSPGGGHGNPLQHSCLKKLMEKGSQQAIAYRVAKSQTQLKLLCMYALNQSLRIAKLSSCHPFPYIFYSKSFIKTYKDCHLITIWWGKQSILHHFFFWHPIHFCMSNMHFHFAQGLAGPPGFPVSAKSNMNCFFISYTYNT